MRLTKRGERLAGFLFVIGFLAAMGVAGWIEGLS